MNGKLENRVNLFLLNQEKAVKNFPLNNNFFNSVCAACYTEKYKELDPKEIAKCKALIQKNADAFSGGQGLPLLAISAVLAAGGTAEERVKAAEKAYLALRREYFPSPYLVFTAFLMSCLYPNKSYDEPVSKLKNVLTAFKEQAPQLINEDKYISLLYFTVGERSPQECAEEAKRCYSFLKQEFYEDSAVRMMSLVLALSRSSTVKKCQQVIQLFDDLAKKHKRFSGGAELGMLAAASLNENTTAEEIIEVQKLLNKNPVLWATGASGQKHRLLWATLLLTQMENSQVLLPQKNVLLAGKSALAQLAAYHVQNNPLRRFQKF